MPNTRVVYVIGTRFSEIYRPQNGENNNVYDECALIDCLSAVSSPLGVVAWTLLDPAAMPSDHIAPLRSIVLSGQLTYVSPNRVDDSNSVRSIINILSSKRSIPTSLSSYVSWARNYFPKIIVTTYLNYVNEAPYDFKNATLRLLNWIEREVYETHLNLNRLTRRTLLPNVERETVSEIDTDDNSDISDATGTTLTEATPPSVATQVSRNSEFDYHSNPIDDFDLDNGDGEFEIRSGGENATIGSGFSFLN